MYFCLCCGYNTLQKKPPGTDEVCAICGWEDDIIQCINPNNYDGVNGVSLVMAQQNFEEYGACSREMLSDVTKPTETSIRNPNWKNI